MYNESRQDFRTFESVPFFSKWYLKKGTSFFKMGPHLAGRTHHKKFKTNQKWYLFYQNGTSKRYLFLGLILQKSALFKKKKSQKAPYKYPIWKPPLRKGTFWNKKVPFLNFEKVPFLLKKGRFGEKRSLFWILKILKKVPFFAQNTYKSPDGITCSKCPKSMKNIEPVPSQSNFETP